MIDTKLGLKTVLRQPSWTHHHSWRQVERENERASGEGDGWTGELTCVVDEDVQSVLSVQEVLGELSDRVKGGEVQVPDHHVTVSCRVPYVLRRLLRPRQVPARHNHPGPCGEQIKHTS